MPPENSDNIEDLEDNQILDKLDEAYQAHQLQNDPKWKLIFNWLKRERDVSERKLRVADPSKPTEIIRLQESIKICDHIANRIFEGIRKDGELALIEAKERELVPETVPEGSPE